MRSGVLALLLVGLSMWGAENVLGASTWKKTYSSGYFDVAEIVAEDVSGNIIAAGLYGESNANLRLAVKKINQIGDINWQKSYDLRKLPYDVAVDSGENIIVLAENHVLKIDKDGSIVWSKAIVSAKYSYQRFYPSAMVALKDDSILVGGSVSNVGGGSKAFISRIDSNGVLQYCKIYGEDRAGSSIKRLISIDESSVLMIGSAYGKNINNYALIEKMDIYGRSIWQKRIYSGITPAYSDGAVMPDGRIILVGAMPTGVQNGYIIRTILDHDGALVSHDKNTAVNWINYIAKVKLASYENGEYLVQGEEISSLTTFVLKISPDKDSSEYVKGVGRITRSLIRTRDNGYLNISRIGQNGGYTIIEKRDQGFAPCGGGIQWQSSAFEKLSATTSDAGLIKSDFAAALVNAGLTEVATDSVVTTLCISVQPELGSSCGEYGVSFGNVEIGSSAGEQIVIYNDGGADLAVSDIALTDPRFEFESECGTVTPGGACDIDLTFSPSQAGPVEGVLSFSSDDPLKQQVQCQLRGYGVDTVPPVIDLLGPASVTVEAGTQYVEGGARAYDAVDGDLSDVLLVEGAVDVGKIGQYLIVYSVEDKSGNRAEKVRTVTVVDTIPPTVTVALNEHVLWPPNKSMREVALASEVNDSGSGVASVVTRLVDEYGQFDFSMEGVPGTLGLQAWRKGSDLDGRSYLVEVSATDYAGNVAKAVERVVVPHDLGKNNR